MSKLNIRGVMASFIVAGCGLAVPAAGFAQAQTSPRPSTPVAMADDKNEALEDQIEFRLETHDVVRKYDIDVEVDEGVVMLSGDVATETQKTQALELAKVDGVVRIEDRIEVDPDADRTLADRAARGLNNADTT
jgi:hypothetical protein